MFVTSQHTHYVVPIHNYHDGIWCFMGGGLVGAKQTNAWRCVKMMRDSTVPSDDERGVRYGNPWCTHEYPILLNDTEDGYYARCLRCLTIGPERPFKEAAHRALLVLGAREAADLQG